MFDQATKDSANTLAEHAAHSADHALNSSKRVATDMINDLSHSVRDTSQHLQDSALRASHNTVKFIKDEPVKSILIAAATGAALMALVGLMSRSSHPRA
jgi:ElaB/YqjD/DUF883 family membrane-anchored ribosome-binding protein